MQSKFPLENQQQEKQAQVGNFWTLSQNLHKGGKSHHHHHHHHHIITFLIIISFLCQVPKVRFHYLVWMFEWIGFFSQVPKLKLIFYEFYFWSWNPVIILCSQAETFCFCDCREREGERERERAEPFHYSCFYISWPAFCFVDDSLTMVCFDVQF